MSRNVTHRPATPPRLDGNVRWAQRNVQTRKRGSAAGGEEQGAGEGAAAGAGDPDLGVAGDLAVAGFAPELPARLVEEAEAVEPARRQLPAAGVEGQHAVERDALAALDERARLPHPAESHGLEPHH